VVREALSQIKGSRTCFQEDALGSSQEGASALFAQEKAAMLALSSYQMAAVKDRTEIEQGLLAPIRPRERRSSTASTPRPSCSA